MRGRRVEVELTDRQARFVDAVMTDLESVSVSASVRRDAKAVRRRVLIGRAATLLAGMRRALVRSGEWARGGKGGR